MDLQSKASADYEYLDAGHGARLERFGPYVLNRPSPVALWAPERPALWAQAAATYHRSSSGGGDWSFRQKLPQFWPVAWDDLHFSLKATGFGHVGLFPEHSCHWEWVSERIRSGPRPFHVLHLFAYTGAMTLAAARAGAEVCHVDAVKDINEWARHNAAESRLKDAPVRWITDDVLKFVAREGRRGRRYEGIILDPPSYGKGPRGERWILEESVLALLDLLPQVAADPPRFVLFTCHTPSFSPPLMGNLLVPWQKRFGGRTETGTMVLTHPECQCVLPTGFFARWER